MVFDSYVLGLKLYNCVAFVFFLQLASSRISGQLTSAALVVVLIIALELG